MKIVKEWQDNRSCPNPYVSDERCMFLYVFHGYILLSLPASKLSQARLQLAEEESTNMARGQHAPHQVSAAVFIRMGLELEDQQ